MQFLKILFWCLLAFVAALFTYGNWVSVPVQLWSGMVALVRLPFLIFVAFLFGLIPTLLYNHAIRWRLRQRLASCERTIAELRTPATPPVFGAPTPVAVPVTPGPVTQTSAPLAVPTAVPPGVA